MNIKKESTVIAVVGVSENSQKNGYKIFKTLVDNGYLVEGIHPENKELFGKKLFRGIRDLPGKPDVVITVVPPQVTEKIVEECRELGIKEIWMQPGSESENAIRKAREYGIEVVHHACFMVKEQLW